MRTYSRKRLSHITPIKIFTDDDHVTVPEMNAPCSPRHLATTPPPPETIHQYDDSMLARSPARSDASSSMKSRESALERRVSLLLRSESPTGSLGIGPSRSATPPHMFEPAPCVLPVPPEESDEDEPSQQSPQPGQERKPQHRRFNSFAATHFFSPKKSQDCLVDSNSKPKANKLTKRMSAAIHTSTITKACSLSPDNSSPATSSKSSPSIRNGIDAGLKALTRASSTLIRKTSPLVHRVYRKDKERPKSKPVERNTTAADASSLQEHQHLNEFANSPTSIVCETPDQTNVSYNLADTVKHTRPHTTQTMPLLLSGGFAASPTSTFVDSVSPLRQHPTALSPDLDDLVNRGTTRLRLASSIRANGRRRLSVTDATKPTVLDPLARHSTDSLASGVASSIASRAPDQELRRTTGCVKRTSQLVDPSSDVQSIISLKRPKSAGKLLAVKRLQDDVFVDSPHSGQGIVLGVTEASGASDSKRVALQENNPNKKVSSEELGKLKTAKVLRMSVSPMVKEVFNKLPGRSRSSTQQPKTADSRVSRASSKASRILGHHFSSKEPLRPVTGNENAMKGVREESTSEDELAL